jgi:hypothetical protein
VLLILHIEASHSCEGGTRCRLGTPGGIAMKGKSMCQPLAHSRIASLRIFFSYRSSNHPSRSPISRTSHARRAGGLTSLGSLSPRMLLNIYGYACSSSKPGTSSQREHLQGLIALICMQLPRQGSCEVGSAVRTVGSLQSADIGTRAPNVSLPHILHGPPLLCDW